MRWPFRELVNRGEPWDFLSLSTFGHGPFTGDFQCFRMSVLLKEYASFHLILLFKTIVKYHCGQRPVNVSSRSQQIGCALAIIVCF